MNDVVLMCKLHRGRKFGDQHSRNSRIPRGPVQSLSQRALCDQFHRDVGQAFMLAEIVNLNDVRMMKCRDNARLTTKTGEQLGVIRIDGPHHL